MSGFEFEFALEDEIGLEALDDDNGTEAVSGSELSGNNITVTPNIRTTRGTAPH